jgi:hypothetical protein
MLLLYYVDNMIIIWYPLTRFSLSFTPSDPDSQLLSINGKTEDEILRSLERVFLSMKTMRQTKVYVYLSWVPYLP